MNYFNMLSVYFALFDYCHHHSYQQWKSFLDSFFFRRATNNGSCSCVGEKIFSSWTPSHITKFNGFSLLVFLSNRPYMDSFYIYQYSLTTVLLPNIFLKIPIIIIKIKTAMMGNDKKWKFSSCNLSKWTDWLQIVGYIPGRFSAL